MHNRAYVMLTHADLMQIRSKPLTESWKTLSILAGSCYIMRNRSKNLGRARSRAELASAGPS